MFSCNSGSNELTKTTRNCSFNLNANSFPKIPFLSTIKIGIFFVISDEIR